MGAPQSRAQRRRPLGGAPLLASSVAGRLDARKPGHELAHRGDDGGLLASCRVQFHLLSYALDLRLLLGSELFLQRGATGADVWIVDPGQLLEGAPEVETLGALERDASEIRLCGC